MMSIIFIETHAGCHVRIPFRSTEINIFNDNIIPNADQSKRHFRDAVSHRRYGTSVELPQLCLRRSSSQEMLFCMSMNYNVLIWSFLIHTESKEGEGSSNSLLISNSQLDLCASSDEDGSSHSSTASTVSACQTSEPGVVFLRIYYTWMCIYVAPMYGAPLHDLYKLFEIVITTNMRSTLRG